MGSDRHVQNSPPVDKPWPGLCLSAFAALAQQNTLTIKQDGAGNSLFVDQSEATDSSVNGLTLSEPQTSFDSSGRVSGSVSFGLSTPPFRRGSDNVASIKLTGTGGNVRLLQTGGAKNDANITATNGASAIVGQSGNENIATVKVGGELSRNLDTDGEFLSGHRYLSSNRGLTAFTTAYSDLGTDISGVVLQSGDRNKATLIAPDTTRGAIVQLGNDNVSVLDLNTNQFGPSVVYTQVGNGLRPLTDAAVTSNTQGTISITQTNGVNGISVRGGIPATQTQP